MTQNDILMAMMSGKDMSSVNMGMGMPAMGQPDRGMMGQLDTSGIMGGGGPNMGGGFGSISSGGEPPSQGRGIMDLMKTMMEGESVGANPAGQSKDMSNFADISSLFTMANQMKANQIERRNPRQRMDSINNRYLQGLMGGV